MPLDKVALKSLALELAAAMPPPRRSEDAVLPQVDVSPRAKATRAILRIADLYGWHGAVIDFLQDRSASYLSDLTDDQLRELLGVMESFVDIADTGSCRPDCLAAS